MTVLFETAQQPDVSTSVVHDKLRASLIAQQMHEQKPVCHYYKCRITHVFVTHSRVNARGELTRIIETAILASQGCLPCKQTTPGKSLTRSVK